MPLDAKEITPIGRARIARSGGDLTIVAHSFATVRAEHAAERRIQSACFDDLDAPVERVGMAAVPLPYAKELELARSRAPSSSSSISGSHRSVGFV